MFLSHVEQIIQIAYARTLHFANNRQSASGGRLGDLALTTRAAISGGRIADPRILGEPFVHRPTQRTMCAAEEYWGGAKGLAVGLYAGGNGPPCLGATYHHYTH
jgi:hypothetical protein